MGILWGEKKKLLPSELEDPTLFFGVLCEELDSEGKSFRTNFESKTKSKNSEQRNFINKRIIAFYLPVCCEKE